MADVYNFNNFQIPHTGVETTNWDSAESSQQHRAPTMRMSSYGSLNFGVRNSDNYALTSLGFKNKGELENPEVLFMDQEALQEDNPYVAGSTVKRVMDDKFTVMGNDTIARPNFDVSATNLVHGQMTAPKKYPSEGWHSFGQKYDFPVPYQG